MISANQRGPWDKCLNFRCLGACLAQCLSTVLSVKEIVDPFNKEEIQEVSFQILWNFVDISVMEEFWKWAQPGHRVMEAFGDENYVGIKEMTMDMKVWRWGPHLMAGTLLTVTLSSPSSQLRPALS